MLCRELVSSSFFNAKPQSRQDAKENRINQISASLRLRDIALNIFGLCLPFSLSPYLPFSPLRSHVRE